MNIFHKKDKGFTLIELLVTIAIIGLLSSVVLASLGSARSKSRDSQRLSTLVSLRTALELYYSKHGAYPSTLGVVYSSDVDATGLFAGSNGGNWIPGLVADKDIAVLPHDPRAGTAIPNCDPTGSWWGNGTTPQYVYASYNGTGYQLASICGVENAITSGNTFFDTWLASAGFTDFHTFKMCVNGDISSQECNGGNWGYF